MLSISEHDLGAKYFASLAEASEHIHEEIANVASALKIGSKEDYFELTDI